MAEERMITLVNGEPRQDARGTEMTLDFRDLALKALGDMAQARFLFRGDYQRLAPEAAITPDMTLMSGTAEGVIFTTPTRGDIIEGLVHWAFGGGWRNHSLIPGIIETFIANELDSGHFLQPGDRVEHRSSRLGDIVVDVVADSGET